MCVYICVSVSIINYAWKKKKKIFLWKNDKKTCFNFQVGNNNNYNKTKSCRVFVIVVCNIVSINIRFLCIIYTYSNFFSLACSYILSLYIYIYSQPIISFVPKYIYIYYNVKITAFNNICIYKSFEIKLPVSVLLQYRVYIFVYIYIYTCISSES